jgi:6-phosphofructokinase 1
VQCRERDCHSDEWGDHSGLNAVIRAAVRTALRLGTTVYGIHQGYLGLTEDQFEKIVDSQRVSGLIGLGGTMLGTARLPEWREPRTRLEAHRNLNKRDISGLIVVGGNGSLAGAHAFHSDGFRVIGIPGSIDDDVAGTEVCLGVDTALNIIIEAIERIRDCAGSIQRAFVVEVMGRDCGALALMAASATGAELCLVPELPSPSVQQISDLIRRAYAEGKPHVIIVAAEGWKPGVDALVGELNKASDMTGWEFRTTVLGYTQRGGAPSYRDRMYGTMMGKAAVMALLNGESGKMVGIVKGKVELIPLEQVVGKLKPIDQDLMAIYQMLDTGK